MWISWQVGPYDMLWMRFLLWSNSWPWNNFDPCNCKKKKTGDSAELFISNSDVLRYVWSTQSTRHTKLKGCLLKKQPRYMTHLQSFAGNLLQNISRSPREKNYTRVMHQYPSIINILKIPLGNVLHILKNGFDFLVLNIFSTILLRCMDEIKMLG